MSACSSASGTPGFWKYWKVEIVDADLLKRAQGIDASRRAA